MCYIDFCQKKVRPSIFYSKIYILYLFAFINLFNLVFEYFYVLIFVAEMFFDKMNCFIFHVLNLVSGYVLFVKFYYF